jgi:hypothetical protein
MKRIKIITVIAILTLVFFVGYKYDTVVLQVQRLELQVQKTEAHATDLDYNFELAMVLNENLWGQLEEAAILQESQQGRLRTLTEKITTLQAELDACKVKNE